MSFERVRVRVRVRANAQWELGCEEGMCIYAYICMCIYVYAQWELGCELREE